MSLWTLLKFDGHFFLLFSDFWLWWLSEVNKLIKRQKYEEKKTWKNTEDTFIKQQKNVFL